MSGFPEDPALICDRFHRWVNTLDESAQVEDAHAWLVACLERNSFAFDVENALERLLDAGGTPKSPDAIDLDVADPTALVFHAPLGLLEGAWLQSLAQAANGHEEAVCELFAAYLCMRGQDAAQSPVAAYRALLVQSGRALPAVNAWQFGQDARVGLAALHFVSAQLALSCHSRVFFPELLGFTLAYAQSTSNWRMAALAEPSRRSRLHAIENHALRAIRITLDTERHCQPAESANARRILGGHALYVGLESAYLARLKAIQTRKPDIAQQVEAMFRRKARYARGYHGRVMLADRCLDDWFAQQPFDGHAFIVALARSPYLAGSPGDRPFKRLAGFGGPMFGVFSAEELALVDQWLASASPAELQAPLGDGSDPTDAASLHLALPCELPLSPTPPIGSQSSVCEKPKSGSVDSRKMFYRLVNADKDPAVHALAQRQVLKVLGKSGQTLSGGRAALKDRFFAYSPERLQHWVNAVHDGEVARYRASGRPPALTKDEYIWGIRQFAPAILVDGCWLQHLGLAAYQDERLHCLLFRIYADELGAGHVYWNHPNVYRRLLDSLEIPLPPVDSLEFAQHAHFLDAAFDLPVYLMAISRFPQRFLPEILGLNLAIELSGLGAQYQSLAAGLEYWGIDPLIVKLHLSIDNLASGHAALAVEAIQLYLDQVREIGGDLAVADYWLRIWRGYRSLGAATRGFRWALGVDFCRHFLPGRIGQALRRLRKTLVQPALS